ncbi:hypothetical protein Trydic_g13962 [Trypoxylus dichotomus]
MFIETRIPVIFSAYGSFVIGLDKANSANGNPIWKRLSSSRTACLFDDMSEREPDKTVSDRTENSRDIERTQAWHMADSITLSGTSRYMGTIERRWQ